MHRAMVFSTALFTLRIVFLIGNVLDGRKQLITWLVEIIRGFSSDGIIGVINTLNVTPALFLEVSNVIAISLLVDVVFPHVFNYIFKRILRKISLRRLKKRPSIFGQIESILIDKVNPLSQQYALMTHQILLGLIFAPFCPLVQVLTPITIFLQYLTYRARFLKFSRIQPFSSPTCIRTTIVCGSLGLLLRSLSGLFALSDNSIFPSSLRRTIIPINLSDIFPKTSRFDSLFPHFVIFFSLLVGFAGYGVYLIISVLRRRSLKVFLKQEIAKCGKNYEIDEARDNIAVQYDKISSYSVPTYEWEKNREWNFLYAYFASNFGSSNSRYSLINFTEQQKLVSEKAISINSVPKKNNSIIPRSFVRIKPPTSSRSIEIRKTPPESVAIKNVEMLRQEADRRVIVKTEMAKAPAAKEAPFSGDSQKSGKLTVIKVNPVLPLSDQNLATNQAGYVYRSEGRSSPNQSGIDGNNNKDMTLDPVILSRNSSSSLKPVQGPLDVILRQDTDPIVFNQMANNPEIRQVAQPYRGRDPQEEVVPEYWCWDTETDDQRLEKEIFERTGSNRSMESPRNRAIENKQAKLNAISSQPLSSKIQQSNPLVSQRNQVQIQDNSSSQLLVENIQLRQPELTSKKLTQIVKTKQNKDEIDATKKPNAKNNITMAIPSSLNTKPAASKKLKNEQPKNTIGKDKNPEVTTQGNTYKVDTTPRESPKAPEELKLTFSLSLIEQPQKKSELVVADESEDMDDMKGKVTERNNSKESPLKSLSLDEKLDREQMNSQQPSVMNSPQQDDLNDAKVPRYERRPSREPSDYVECEVTDEKTSPQPGQPDPGRELNDIDDEGEEEDDFFPDEQDANSPLNGIGREKGPKGPYALNMLPLPKISECDIEESPSARRKNSAVSRFRNQPASNSSIQEIYLNKDELAESQNKGKNSSNKKKSSFNNKEQQIQNPVENKISAFEQNQRFAQTTENKTGVTSDRPITKTNSQGRLTSETQAQNGTTSNNPPIDPPSVTESNRLESKDKPTKDKNSNNEINENVREKSNEADNTVNTVAMSKVPLKPGKPKRSGSKVKEEQYGTKLNLNESNSFLEDLSDDAPTSSRRINGKKQNPIIQLDGEKSQQNGDQVERDKKENANVKKSPKLTTRKENLALTSRVESTKELITDSLNELNILNQKKSDPQMKSTYSRTQDRTDPGQERAKKLNSKKAALKRPKVNYLPEDEENDVPELLEPQEVDMYSQLVAIKPLVKISSIPTQKPVFSPRESQQTLPSVKLQAAPPLFPKSDPRRLSSLNLNSFRNDQKSEDESMQQGVMSTYPKRAFSPREEGNQPVPAKKLIRPNPPVFPKN